MTSAHSAGDDRGGCNACHERDEALRTARVDVVTLTAALDSAREIGIALGIIMTTFKVDKDVAFKILAQASQQTNRKVRDIAADVAFTGSLSDPTLHQPA